LIITDTHIISLAPIVLAGYLVSVTMVFVAVDKSYGTGHITKLTMKKNKSIKSDVSLCKGNLTISTAKCDSCKGKPKLIYAKNTKRYYTPCKGKPKRKL
jgi:hypothetical protein